MLAGMAATGTTMATNSGATKTGGPDRVTVLLLTVAAVLAVLAVLAWQMRSTSLLRPQTPVVFRRVYETRVIETRVGGGRGGTSSTQSVSSTAAPVSGRAPATRSS
jgi:hypothetical protein